MRIRRKSNIKFTMIEVVFSLAIFVILACTFFSLADSMRKYGERLELETEAISVLDNFVERIAAEQNPDFAKAKKILDDEFSKSSIAMDKEARPLIASKDGQLCAGIEKKGKIAAEIKFKTTGGNK